MSNPLHIVTVSTNLPRRCGIATFNADVVRELGVQGAKVSNISMRRTGEKRRYAAATTLSTINQDVRNDYTAAAQLINKIKPDIVLVEHEFGIYGGLDGSYVLDLLQHLNIPTALIAHTIPFTESNKYQRSKTRMLEKIGSLVDVVITISGLSQKRLQEVFNKAWVSTPVIHIPHGTPDVSLFVNEAQGNTKNTNQITLSTFGLISERKGVRDVIEILPHIVNRHPNVIYKVLGAPHPADLRAQQYLRHVKRNVHKLGLDDNVQFVTRFLSVREIMQSLHETDIYITYYQDPDQASSGTLSYAIAAGCCVVSTPYVHARELLSNNRGILIPFFNQEVLEETLLELLDNPVLRDEYRRQAISYGRTTSWPKIGRLYYLILQQLVKSHSQTVQGYSVPA